MEFFLQQLINGITLGGFYALVALGYTMVFGIIQLINFAHGEFFAAGGYMGVILLSFMASQGYMDTHPWVCLAPSQQEPLEFLVQDHAVGLDEAGVGSDIERCRNQLLGRAFRAGRQNLMSHFLFCARWGCLRKKEGRQQRPPGPFVRAGEVLIAILQTKGQGNIEGSVPLCQVNLGHSVPCGQEDRFLTPFEPQGVEVLVGAQRVFGKMVPESTPPSRPIS